MAPYAANAHLNAIRRSKGEEVKESVIGPTLLYGLDPLSIGFARRLLEDTRLREAARAMPRLFDPASEPGADLRQILAELSAEGGDAATEVPPQVIILVDTSLARQESVVDRLQEISGTLRTAFPGNQSVTLVGLMPTLLGSAQKKLEMFRLFQDLEKRVTSIPFLRAVFVHEILPAPGGSEELEAVLATNEVVGELLFRELVDGDFQDEIGRMASRPLGRDATAGGRRRYLSSLGARVLYFPRGEALAQLCTGLQLQVFEQGLVDVGSLSTEDLAIIRTRVEGEIESLAGLLGQEIAKGQPVLVRPPPPVEHLVEHLHDPSSWQADLLDRINRGVESAVELGSSTRPASHEVIREGFLGFFDESPGHLAGVVAYAEEWAGERAPGTEEEEDRPSGIPLLHMLLVVAPSLAALEDVFTPAARETLAELEIPVPVREAEQSTWSWLESILELALQHAPAEPEGMASWHRFLRRAYTTALECLLDDRGASRCPVALTQALAEESATLGRMAEDIDRTITSVQVELVGLNAEFGWVRRLLNRSEYRKRRRELESRLAEQRAQGAWVVATHGRLVDFLVNLLDAVVLPNATTAQAVKHAREQVQTQVAELDAFLTGIRAPFQRRVLASAVPPQLTALESTVGIGDELDVLRAFAVGPRSVPELAAEVLEFDGAGHPRYSVSGPPSYASCGSLRDYFEAGPQTLLDRITDYVEILFGPVGLFDVLDVVELVHGDDSQAFLSGFLERTTRPLRFSPGFRPLAEERGGIARMHLVRSAERVCRKLEERYEPMFSHERRLIDSGDARRIDFNCLVMGFPAFLVHGLSECREQARDAGLLEAGDVWPEVMLGQDEAQTAGGTLG